MSNSHGTLFVVPSDEEDQVMLYSPKPPADAKQAARQIEWTGPQELDLKEGLPMTADALQTWMNEQKAMGFRFQESSNGTNQNRT